MQASKATVRIACYTMKFFKPASMLIALRLPIFDCKTIGCNCQGNVDLIHIYCHGELQSSTATRTLRPL